MKFSTKKIIQAVLSYGAHIGSLIAMPYVVPMASTLFFIPSLITLAVISMAGFLSAVISTSDAIDSSRWAYKSVRVERAIHGAHVILVGLWLIAPMCVMLHSAWMIPFILSGVLYLATFVVAMLQDQSKQTSPGPRMN